MGRKIYYAQICNGEDHTPIIYSSKRQLLFDLCKWAKRLDFNICHIAEEEWDGKWERKLLLLSIRSPKLPKGYVFIQLIRDEVSNDKKDSRLFHHLIEVLEPEETPKDLPDDNWLAWASAKMKEKDRQYEKWEMGG